MHQQISPCGCDRPGSKLQPHAAVRPLPAARFTRLTTPASTACCAGCATSADADANRDSASVQPALRWRITGMDCPGCACTIETAVQKLPQVTQARVIFASEKLEVCAPVAMQAAIEQAVKQAGFRLHAADAPALPPAASHWRDRAALLLLALLMLTSWLISQQSPIWGDRLFVATALAGLLPVANSAWQRIRSGSPFSIETLMTAAAAGALVTGAHAEAAMVLLLFLIGERLEAWAAAQARRGVTALMALRPERATRLQGAQRVTVPLAALQPGDIIEIAAGGRLPVDGELLQSSASFDESALTGESLPVSHQPGDRLMAGATSVDRLVQIKVTSLPGESAIDRILQLIDEAESHRAPAERFIDRFSRIYTPAIMLLALLVMVIPPLSGLGEWQPWIYKGLTLLLIGCPCALVISTPAAVTSALASAARQGVLLKGGAALEQLSRVQVIAFDKTGTLTLGKPQVTAIHAFGQADEAALLRLAAAAERGSGHPLAQAIVAEAAKRQLTLPEAQQQQTLAGSGIRASIDGVRYQLLTPRAAPGLSEQQRQRVMEYEREGNTVVILLQADRPLGLLALQDRLREEAAAAIDQLRAAGIASVMLTGDNPRAAAAIAAELNIEYRAGLLPADKVSAVRALSQQQPLAMVGDGINDAPAMKAAAIGIAMGSGTDVALETADAALTQNRLTLLPQTVALARRARAIVLQNITLALGLKALFLLTTLLGLTGLWLAVLADSGATALVTANALRLLRQPPVRPPRLS
ncbi:zinc/cadmium/mercury/lead-transporting ATPase [Pantoea sp. M_9]|uniref:zinc/cadmium/mercury/lead-transporting ATPase n=1 Tax=Pantoea sp. M_9 TaxID=2608041 RepID=UPI001232B93D|nr:zinc/cadmium/mercury/lead-transporting ATPase [Pantoea sp. M_9]KAA5964893.1 zinc/cadmium/mercury/lead-transporting ATPase [Pantoea sp. M_9]